LCLLFRGEAAILIVFGEISYGKHKKLSHPFLGVGFSATDNKGHLFVTVFEDHAFYIVTLKSLNPDTAPVLSIKLYVT
jgi:hypothetical protein